VAEAADVSISTVSRVLKGGHWVSPEAQQRVEAAIRELDYAKRSPASSPTADGQAALGLMIAGGEGIWDRYPFFRRAVTHVVEAAQRFGGITVVRGEGDAEQVSRLAKDHGFGGLLVLLPHGRFELVQRVGDRVPVVWMLGESAGLSPVDHVGPDNDAVGRTACEHLLAAGCTRLMFATDHGALPLVQARAQGFWTQAVRQGRSAACVVAGVEPAMGTLYGGQMIAAQDAAAVATAVANHVADSGPGERVGLFVPSDIQAARLHPRLAEAGVFADDKLKIVSCDRDAATLMDLNPRPVSIDLDLAAVARTAVDRVMRRIADPDLPLGSIRILPKPPRLAVNPAGVD
jgi:DNA-binding LacI/PurR family transcriptional regulator